MPKPQAHPPKNLLVAALILVNEPGKILLAKRPKGKTMAGLWEFPGGKVNKGETLEDALIRECQEELDIILTPAALSLVFTVHHDYPDFHLEMPMFLARDWQGEIKGMEGQKLAWVKPEDLADYPMPPADLPLIKKIPEILKTF